MPAPESWDSVTHNGRSWSRSEFEGLPLIERVRLLSSGELRFFSDGQEMAARDAIKGKG